MTKLNCVALNPLQSKVSDQCIGQVTPTIYYETVSEVAEYLQFLFYVGNQRLLLADTGVVCELEVPQESVSTSFCKAGKHGIMFRHTKIRGDAGTHVSCDIRCKFVFPFSSLASKRDLLVTAQQEFVTRCGIRGGEYLKVRSSVRSITWNISVFRKYGGSLCIPAWECLIKEKKNQPSLFISLKPCLHMKS